jgi:glyoxylase-like metal-dependent hydrolase (beta-lactamase superfamily II)
MDSANARQIASGLWYWTAYHREWRQDVGCVAFETGDGLILIDPLDPPRELRKADHVLITVYWHGRSSRDLRPKRLWAPVRSTTPLRRRGVDVTDPFRPGDTLPEGVQAYASGRSAEVVYWLPDYRALAVGDVLLGGPLRICPDHWVGKGGQEAVREALKPLVELPIRRVLVSHGPPVTSGGKKALTAAVEA